MGLYLIKAKLCIKNTRRCRDDIHAFGVMIYNSHGELMIYHACRLGYKKSLLSFDKSDFLELLVGLEPTTC